MYDFYVEMKRIYLLQVYDYEERKGYISGLCGIAHESAVSAGATEDEVYTIAELFTKDIKENYRKRYIEDMDFWVYEGYLRHSLGEHIDLDFRALTDYYIAPILDFGFRIKLLDKLISKYEE